MKIFKIIIFCLFELLTYGFKCATVKNVKWWTEELSECGALLAFRRILRVIFKRQNFIY